MSTTVSANVANKILGYYTDSSGKMPVRRDKEGKVIISFGDIVPGQDSRPIMMYVRNEHKYPISLEARAKDDDLQFTQYPQYLNPQEIAPMVVVFKCAADRIDPLDTTFGFVVRIMNKVPLE